MRSAVIIAALVVLVVASTAVAEPYVSVWGAENPASQATSSWYGNVGLIVIPSANTPPASAATISGHWVDREPEATWLATVNFGVTAEFEVGGSYIELPNSDSEAVINLKYRLAVAKWLEQPDIPDIAVGCFDVSNQINRSIYLVLSKGFPVDATKENSPRINLHAGWAESDLGEGALDGFFAGLEFNALKNALIQAEYDGDAFNADLRYNVTPTISVDVGLLDGDLGAGATYRSQF